MRAPQLAAQWYIYHCAASCGALIVQTQRTGHSNPMVSPLKIPKGLTRAAFDDADTRVFAPRALSNFVTQRRDEWNVSKETPNDAIIEALIKQIELEKILVRSPNYDDTITRYVWRNPSPYVVALSLRPNAYLSHGTALVLNDLSDEIPKTIYVNKEQSAKPSPQGTLTQEAINRAFAAKPRASRYIYHDRDFRFVLLSGKNTGQLDVVEMLGPNGERLRVTKVERSLIDITVRPHYAGGVHRVLATFERARQRASVNTLVALLKKLGYVYPYHQAVGFYLEKAGFPATRLQRLKKLGMQFDFYLAHGLKQLDYDPEWRIYFPRGL